MESARDKNIARWGRPDTRGNTNQPTNRPTKPHTKSYRIRISRRNRHQRTNGNPVKIQRDARQSEKKKRIGKNRE